VVSVFSLKHLKKLVLTDPYVTVNTASTLEHIRDLEIVKYS
jgi:hypothetical protein